MSQPLRLVRERADGLSHAFLRAAAKPAVCALALLGYAGYLAYHLTRFQLSRVWPLRPVGDSAILFDLSQQVIASSAYPAHAGTGDYASVFPYPPPAVLMLGGFAAAGPHIYAVVWFFLIAVALFVVIRAVLSGESATTRAAWLLIGLLAIAVADSPVSWDMRNANSNLIYLAFVMLAFVNLRRRPSLAGCCIAVSVAFKVYSGLLLVWLLFFRPKAAVAAIVASIVLWLAWPLATFGPADTLRVYAGWREQVAMISDPVIYSLPPSKMGAPIVTLRRAVMSLTGTAAEANATRLLLGGLLTAWSTLLLWYGWRAFRAPGNAAQPRSVLADWMVLLLVPLPFSPWLEPYHAIALLPAALLFVIGMLDVGAALLFVIGMLDVGAASRARIAAASAVAGIVLINQVLRPFPLRGLSLFAQFVIVVTALAFIRSGIPGKPRESQ